MNSKKEYLLLSIIGVIACFIVLKTISFSSKGTIKTVLIKQNGAILTLDTSRVKQNEEQFWINRIDFPQNVVLKHPQYGNLGYKENFFLDLSASLKVLQEGVYILAITSDDGFRLMIDEKTVCEFPQNRAMAATTCRVQLTKGEHLFKMSYFQGYGPMGLKAEYQKEGNPGTYLMGEDSKFFQFKEPK